MGNVQTMQGGPAGNRKRIGKKVGNVVAIMLVVSIVVVVTLSVSMFRALIRGMLQDRCVNGTNMLAYALSSVEGTDVDVNRMLDELKERMNCEFTIFEGDTRTYTTVIQNGQRVVGTRLSSDLSKIVLQQGQSYVGEATILDEQYLCSYVPTRGADGSVNGLIFAGVSSAKASFQTAAVIGLSALITVVAILISILFLAAYLKKKVSIPLAEITKVAERLERGDLGLARNEHIAVSVHSDDEIGELGRIFEKTIGRMRAYIGEISGVLNAISNGDLTIGASQDYIGDFSSIRKSLDSIQAKLNSTMYQISMSADQVSSGSEQVSNGAQALAQGATEQASSVQELAATITEISENAKKTAKATEEANQFVEQAGAQLNISVGHVQHLNEAMEKISKSSSEISEIIAAIENIAFQTNILALNASVEAAHAGSAGKGFALVANEVRSLATKSDEAAKATKELIEASLASVHEGSDVVTKVTEALERTSQSAGGVTSQMSIVVKAVDEQTTAIDQVTEGMDQISAVVQTNSATSEESAAASEELSSQANLLKGLVSAFRLGNMR